MNFSLFNPENTQEVIALFSNVFSASEGEAEGQVIGDLVKNLITQTKPDDLVAFVAKDDTQIVGCIIFSRFSVPNDQVAFILSPVAVSTNDQGTGIGQQLINHGLRQLRSLGIELVITYGDPAFYRKTGFEQISESVIKAPHPLSQPIGWLAQSMDGKPIEAMSGATQCVEALSDPMYW